MWLLIRTEFLPKVLAIVCLVMAHQVSYIRVDWLGHYTFAAYIIVLGGILISYVLGEAPAIRLEFVYAVVGAILFIIAGAYSIHWHKSSNHQAHGEGIALGVLAILAAIALIVDAFFLGKKLK